MNLLYFADADEGSNSSSNFKVISKCDGHKQIHTLRFLCRIDDNFYLTLLFTLLMLMMAATVGEISSDLYRHQNGLSKSFCIELPIVAGDLRWYIITIYSIDSRRSYSALKKKVMWLWNFVRHTITLSFLGFTILFHQFKLSKCISIFTNVMLNNLVYQDSIAIHK